MEYTDKDVPIECPECSETYEGIPAMIIHILEKHPEYSSQEVRDVAYAWAEEAYAEIELKNIERAEFFRRHGYDPEDDRWDDPS